MQLLDEKSLFLVRKKLTLNDITQFTQSFQTTESGTRRLNSLISEKRQTGRRTNIIIKTYKHFFVLGVKCSQKFSVCFFNEFFFIWFSHLSSSSSPPSGVPSSPQTNSYREEASRLPARFLHQYILFPCIFG